MLGYISIDSKNLNVEELHSNLPISYSSQLDQLNLESTLQELSLYEFNIELDHPGRDVEKALKENPLLPGVILTEQGQFIGMISRRCFLEQMGKPYGIELFWRRPIKSLFFLQHRDVLILPKNTLIVRAVQQSLQRQADLVYEPIIVEIELKVYRLLDVNQLLIAQSYIHELTAQLLNRQTLIQENINEQLRQEIAERKRIELESLERSRLVSLNADCAMALVQSKSLTEMLQQCAQALIKHLDAEITHIWTLNRNENVLELQASVGTLNNQSVYNRIPASIFQTAESLKERQLQSFDKDTLNIHNQKLAARMGFAANIFYSLKVSGRLVGMIAIFTKQSLPDSILQEIESVLNSIALGIQRKQVESALKKAKADLEIRVKERTAQLANSEQRFRFLGEIIPQQVWTATPEGSINYVNQRVLEYLSETKEKVLGNGWQNYIHPEDLPQCLERWQKSLSTGELYEHEMRLKRAADDTYRWHIARALPRFNDEEQIMGWFGTNTDINDQKQTETALKKAKEKLEIKVQERTVQLQNSEQQYRSVVETVKEVIFQTDITGLLTFLNPAWTEITGFIVEESIGTSFLNYIHADDSPSHWEFFQSLIERQKDYYHHEVRYLTASGNYIWMEIFTHLILNSDGSIICVAGTLNDISQRKQAEEEIRKAMVKEKELNALKARFISMASHELRNPLSTILISNDLLKSYGHKLSDKKKEQAFNKIETAVHRMTELLEDVLVMGKAQANSLEFHPEKLNLKDFCEDLIEDIQKADHQKHSLDFKFNGESASVKMDRKLLQHILNNLLSNAFKYSPEGKTVKFMVDCRKKTAIFQIIDEGIGIPLSDQERLFEAFHRSSNVGNIPGTGLGLAITKNAVDLHGGSITFESTLDVGTTFTVSIPTNSSC